MNEIQGLNQQREFWRHDLVKGVDQTQQSQRIRTENTNIENDNRCSKIEIEFCSGENSNRTRRRSFSNGRMIRSMEPQVIKSTRTFINTNGNEEWVNFLVA
ncbi:MAG: hypothetical protein EZS28_010940 [Streblomastix strix]|uniref:Uncharacterized protein n=1 Tax=Streblomastix strix TaxID=222440 RepID=A0A5J4WGP3_9EUKA|nr:MAG: hypothetical protein EZS28_010940 [Streblomastix strix]